MASKKKVLTMPLKNKIPIPIILALLIILQSVKAVANQSGSVNPETSDDSPTAVTPPQRPTQVLVGAYLIGLSRVSPPSEAFPSFEVEMFIDLSWQDKRLSYVIENAESMVFLEEEAEEKLSEIWSPDIEIQNEIEQRITESIELIIFPDGTVQYEERFGALLNAEMDLRRFPFDKQTFDLELQSFVWDQNDLILIVNEEQLGMDTDFLTPEWVVTEVAGFSSVSSEIRDDQAISTYTFRIQASRYAGHYLLRIMTPLMFVMLLTWSAFWTTPAERIRMGFIALLTVVASHTVISQSLPRLQYPTFIDIFLTICYIFATTLIIVSTWVRRLDEGGAADRARKIDHRTRWMLPLGALVVMAISAFILWL
jgi:hypothetical protein